MRFKFFCLILLIVVLQLGFTSFMQDAPIWKIFQKTWLSINLIIQEYKLSWNWKRLIIIFLRRGPYDNLNVINMISFPLLTVFSFMCKPTKKCSRTIANPRAYSWRTRLRLVFWKQCLKESCTYLYRVIFLKKFNSL